MVGTLIRLLWIAGGIAQMGVVAAMLRRKLRTEYPSFFFFLLASVVQFWVLLPMSLISYRSYFYSFWTFSLVNIAIEFAVLYELFDHIFRPYESLRRLGAVLFRWVCIVVLIVAAAVAATSLPTSKFPLINIAMSIDRSVYLMQVGLVLFMMLFAPYVGLRMRHRIFGIALGFGLYASTELMTMLAYAATGPHALSTINIVRESAWLIAVTIWIVYVLMPEPERRRARQFERPEEWNSMLSGIAYGKPESAFLPNVVDTVEKVLARRASALIIDPASNRATLRNS